MSELPKHLASLSKAELEGLCARCGLCCYAKIHVDKSSSGGVFIPDLKCKYLTMDANKSCCSVYDNRHKESEGWCLPLEKAIEQGVFPNNCPYVRDMQGYVGATVVSEGTYHMIKSKIKDVLSSGSKPDWISDSDWNSFLQS